MDACWMREVPPQAVRGRACAVILKPCRLGCLHACNAEEGHLIDWKLAMSVIVLNVQARDAYNGAEWQVSERRVPKPKNADMFANLDPGFHQTFGSIV